MEENPVLKESEPHPVRPTLLTVLCILTFIGSGWSVVSSLVAGLFNDAFRTAGEALSEQFPLPEMAPILEAPVSYFFATALLYAGSVTGAFFMWRLHRTGFHVYTISQILLLIAPMVFLGLTGPPMVEVLFSGIFIILYSTQIKYLSQP